LRAGDRLEVPEGEERVWPEHREDRDDREPDDDDPVAPRQVDEVEPVEVRAQATDRPPTTTDAGAAELFGHGAVNLGAQGPSVKRKSSRRRRDEGGRARDVRDDLTYEPLLERDGVRVSRSPWGPEDEIGRLNWITPESSLALLARTGGTRIFDLSVDYFMGMPSFQAFGDPPYQISMTHTPRGTIADNASGMGADVHRRYSYCGDAVSMYTHLGTHIDTLIHLGYYGHYWNGFNADQHLGSRAWTVGGADKYPPLIARGVVLDVAALHGADRVPDDLVIGPDDLRGP